MRVIAFDPGYGRLGISIVERSGGKDRLIFSECFETNITDDHHIRLGDIAVRVRSVCKEFSPTVFAVEALFFNTNTTTAIRVAEVRGVLLACAAELQLDVIEVGPLEVKLAITGYGKSKKSEVKKMMRLLFPVLQKQSCRDDEFDAIAVGVTALTKTHSALYRLQKNPRLLQK